MEINMEWNVMCRICLQDGEMLSIFDKDGTNMCYSDKIMTCSSILIQKGMNLPEQICLKCVDDLNVAYKFRSNCESSDAILQSFAESTIITTNNGELYSFKPPSGLKIRRVPIKEEHLSNDDISETEVYIDEDDDNAISISDGNDNLMYGKIVKQEWDDDDDDDDDNIINGEPEYINYEIEEKDQILSMEDNSNSITSVKNKNVNVKKTGNSLGTGKKSSIDNITTKTTPDGTTTIIRVKRKLEIKKPMQICEICGNTYKYKHALESHMRRHRGEKPFPCHVCGKAFVIAFELRRHMRTHTGQKPYGCHYCDRKFSDFGSRIKHERSHTGERPYVCVTCGKTFAYSHVLSSHVLTHTGEKKHHCKQCGKRFTKAHHLKAHLNTHFGKGVSAATLTATPAQAQMHQNIDENDDKLLNFVITTSDSDSKILIDEDVQIDINK